MLRPSVVALYTLHTMHTWTIPSGLTVNVGRNGLGTIEWRARTVRLRNVGRGGTLSPSPTDLGEGEGVVQDASQKKLDPFNKGLMPVEKPACEGGEMCKF